MNRILLIAGVLFGLSSLYGMTTNEKKFTVINKTGGELKISWDWEIPETDDYNDAPESLSCQDNLSSEEKEKFEKLLSEDEIVIENNTEQVFELPIPTFIQYASGKKEACPTGAYFGQCHIQPLTNSATYTITTAKDKTRSNSPLCKMKKWKELKELITAAKLVDSLGKYDTTTYDALATYRTNILSTSDAVSEIQKIKDVQDKIDEILNKCFSIEQANNQPCGAGAVTGLT